VCERERERERSSQPGCWLGTKRIRRRNKKEKKAAVRQTKDPWNDHVPATYTNDDWKLSLSDKAQIYGKN
jgi:hypothetical protein